MASKIDNWKRHVSQNLIPHLYLVDEKYINLTEEDKHIRKNILKEKNRYESFKLRKQKKKDNIRSIIEEGDAIIRNKNMSSYTKAKQLKTIYKRLCKAGSPKAGLQYLLRSLQEKEQYQGKNHINLLYEYHEYDILTQRFKKN